MRLLNLVIHCDSSEVSLDPSIRSGEIADRARLRRIRGENSQNRAEKQKWKCGSVLHSRINADVKDFPWIHDYESDSPSVSGGMEGFTKR